MNRRNFALSWGRKMFFGFSLPVTLVVGLLYLRSFIFPETLLDTIYFITTYFGHFGFLNILIYFFIFCPIILLMPTYYVSRLWSLFLILLLNLFLILDALSFSSFHKHLYEFISPALWEALYQYFLHSKIAVAGLIAAFLIILITFWVRGEMTWKHMQRRFSNPVSNWYILLILVLFFTSKAIFYFRPVDKSLASVFPLNANFQKEGLITSDNRKLFYPSGDLACKGKSNPNIMVIVVREWSKGQIAEEMMPKVYHLKDHAVNYQGHMNISENADDGLFNLMYSIPASYKELKRKSSPAFIQELKRRGYEMTSLEAGQMTTGFNNWIDNRSGGETQPFFLSLTINNHPFEADAFIDQMILKLEESGILRNTEIILTSAYAGNGETQLPLLWFRPERKFMEVNHLTTPYDVIPSLMQEVWNCKNAFKVASVGVPLSEKERPWILSTSVDGFKVHDLKNENVLFFKAGEVFVTGEKPQYDLIFSALKMMTRFNRP